MAEGLFDVEWANLIGEWCVNYVREYDTAPGEQIVTVFEDWAKHTTANDDTIGAVDEFLQALSDEQKAHDEKTNAYLLDLAWKYFNTVRLKREWERANAELSRGQVKEALERFPGMKQVEFEYDSFIEPAADFEVWVDAFNEERRRPLITYPGDAGRWLGDSFVRGEFYSFMAPDKTGKSTYLIDLAYRGLRRRNRVAYFDMGDEDEHSVKVRLACRATARAEYPDVCDMPIDWDDQGELITKAEPIDDVDPMETFRHLNRICKFPDAFRITCHPNSSTSIDDVDQQLESWALHGWRPDIVIVDYADIMAPPTGTRDPLEQIDESWKRMRRLSQKRNCLVLTATQSSALAYGSKGLLSKKHFSGRKTKLAHVNGMIGINVTDKERDHHSARLNWVVRRRVKNRRLKSWVRVAGCFNIHNPVIISKL